MNVVVKIGASMWALPTQYGGFHSGERAQFAKFKNDSSTWSTHIRIAYVWPNSGESSSDGTTNSDAAGLQTLRLPSWGGIS